MQQFLATADSPCAAREIASTIGVPKADVNKTLYVLLKDGAVQKTSEVPPRWTRAKTPALVAAHPWLPLDAASPLVILDLGNVHCLDRLMPYVINGLISLWAYADLAYNGPKYAEAGVGNYFYFQSNDASKNAADTKMIWDVALHCEEVRKGSSPDGASKIYVLTLDQGFRALAGLARDCGVQLEFVTSFEALRDVVE